MKLNIAGESIVLSVPYSEQEHTRETEAQLNNLFKTWRGRFPEKSDRELLAMIAWQYAEHYASLLREREDAYATAEKTQRILDEALAQSPNSETTIS